MRGLVIIFKVAKATWEHLRGSHAIFFCVRQDYEDLEKQLKEVFKERSNILHQLTKTSRELDGIKVNLQVRWKLNFLAAKDLACLGGLALKDSCIFFFTSFEYVFWAWPWELFIIIWALKRNAIWNAVWESVVCKFRKEKIVCLARPSVSQASEINLPPVFFIL